MIPAYLKTVYKDQECFDQFKTLFTIHNLAYQGEFPTTSFKKTGLPEELNSVSKGIIHNGKVNFMKSGLLFADVINTVSETYANEIRTEEKWEGLKDVLAKRKDDLYGIVNGIDTNVWNPEKDKQIPKKYSAKILKRRLVNKKELAEKFGFNLMKTFRSLV